MPIPMQQRSRPSLPFILLCAFLMLLWVFGGASRADAGGQIVVQAGAALALALTIIFGPYPDFASSKRLWILLLAAGLLAAVQLCPLPPGIWQALPGRSVFADATLGMQSQPWRSWSIVPGATLNSATGLLVPFTVLLLLASIRAEERTKTVMVLLLLVTGSALLGLLQLSGGSFDNPFINDTPGIVSGSFANRNHFALFLAIGCLLVTGAALQLKRNRRWQVFAAIGVQLLFLLIILGTGSRAGLLLGGISFLFSGILLKKKLKNDFRNTPKWVLPTVVATVLVIFSAFIWASVAMDRAFSIQRTFDIDAGQDMRAKGFPVVLEMINTYFPFGSGIGSFDPVFRMHEPDTLLKVTYFGHAHNDVIEIILESGVFGAVILSIFGYLWLMQSIRIWRMPAHCDSYLSRVGSLILLVIVIGSLFDYPIRTPMFSAIAIVAAYWLFYRRRSPQEVRYTS